MKRKGIIVTLICISTIHILAQQPQTVVFKVRKNNVKEVNVYNVGHVYGGVTNLYEEPAFIVVEENATFQGGDLGAFRNWVQSKIVYPQVSAEKGNEGRVFILFAISSIGDICDIKIIRSSGDPLLDAEAVRVFRTSPKWIAARQSGSPVKQQFTVPITFKLQQ